MSVQNNIWMVFKTKIIVNSKDGILTNNNLYILFLYDNIIKTKT